MDFHCFISHWIGIAEVVQILLENVEKYMHSMNLVKDKRYMFHWHKLLDRKRYIALSPCYGIIETKRTFHSTSRNSQDASYDTPDKGQTKRNNSNEEGRAKYNQVNIQMLYDGLHKQIFGTAERPHVHDVQIQKIREHLKHHDLWDKGAPVIEDVNLQLPKLSGNIDSHFRYISEDLNRPYKKLADDLCMNNIPEMPKEWSTQTGWTKYDSNTGVGEAVPFPDCTNLIFDVEVLMAEGQYPTMATAVSPNTWYSWVSPRIFEKTSDTSKMTLEDMIPLETMDNSHTPPSGDWRQRLIIGHNVGFDRSFIKEQYYIKGSQMKFLDTMSLHIGVSGLTSTQRILYTAHNKGESGESRKEIRDMMQTGFVPSFRWTSVGSPNNLRDVHKLYCPEDPRLQKASRDVFVNGEMNDVRKQFQELMTYCANDVKATHAVFQKLWVEFHLRFPHPVTLYGMLEMSTAYLPINSTWQKYKKASDRVYSMKQKELRNTLVQLANEAKKMETDKSYKEDLWLWDLEWNSINTFFPRTVKDANRQTTVANEDQTKKKKKPIRLKFSYPKWFSELCPKRAEVSADTPLGPSKISTLRRVTPKLLKLTWKGFPLHFNSEYGWGYLQPSNEALCQDGQDDVLVELAKQESELSGKKEDEEQAFPIEKFLDYCKKLPHYSELQNENEQISILERRIMELQSKLEDSRDNETRFKLMNEIKKREKELKIIQKKKKQLSAPKSDGSYDIGIPGVKFLPLPHKDGPNNRVGNPLSKDFLPYIEDGILVSQLGTAMNSVLKITIMCSYWKNSMSRVHEQIALKLPEEALDENVKSCELYQSESYVGAILPRVVTAGTITRRAVEKTWLTASNAYPDRIGSELKAMVQSPPGYCFVGADVDSQELWIAAILGDSYFGGLHGCTALGWMTLQGNKADGTDLHSKTANIVGITRDQAKVFNYGRIYGAGQRFAKRLLMQFNHQITEKEAQKKAKNMYEATKGKKLVVLRDAKAANEAEERNDTEDDEFKDIDEGGQWYGGSESAMFNKLESIAMSYHPTTPVLGGRISKALEPKKVNTDFMTSRVNWVVQSSAVDYLHLMLVCMKWLCQKYNIDGRFSISIHDEVRYLVKKEDRHRAALALQITNLLTRSMFAHKLNMNDLPQAIAFFSAVDIDRCLRKESHLDCKTPSNPLGLHEGYNIPPGEALTVYDIIDRTGGSLQPVINRNTQDSSTVCETSHRTSA